MLNMGIKCDLSRMRKGTSRRLFAKFDRIWSIVWGSCIIKSYYGIGNYVICIRLANMLAQQSKCPSPSHEERLQLIVKPELDGNREDEMVEGRMDGGEGGMMSIFG